MMKVPPSQEGAVRHALILISDGDDNYSRLILRRDQDVPTCRDNHLHDQYQRQP